MAPRTATFCLALGLSASVIGGVGCDSIQKRDGDGGGPRKSSADRMNELEPPVVSRDSEENPIKGKLFKNNRLSGGLSDQARDIESDFGIN